MCGLVKPSASVVYVLVKNTYQRMLIKVVMHQFKYAPKVLMLVTFRSLRSKPSVNKHLSKTIRPMNQTRNHPLETPRAVEPRVVEPRAVEPRAVTQWIL